jgi:hypothetical protein
MVHPLAVETALVIPRRVNFFKIRLINGRSLSSWAFCIFEDNNHVSAQQIQIYPPRFAFSSVVVMILVEDCVPNFGPSCNISAIFLDRYAINSISSIRDAFSNISRY